MAKNTVRWVGNLYGLPGPLIMLGLFQAGATQAIKRGEILERTASSGTAYVPIDSNFAMNANIAIANEEIKSGDRAGYYEIMVPRPGDVFEFELAAADDVEVGAPVFYSSSEKVTTTGTVNVLGYAVGQEHYPAKQGHLSDDASGDSGTSIANTSHVRMTFATTASVFAAMVRSDRTPDIGDGNGYTGFVFDPAGTSIQANIDGDLTSSLESDGSFTDESGT